MARSAEITLRVGCTGLVVLAPGKAAARQPDAGVALTVGCDSDMGTAAAHGHTYAGHRKIEMHTRQQLNAALKTEAHLLFYVSANERFAQLGLFVFGCGTSGADAFVFRITCAVHFVSPADPRSDDGGEP
jgi:hypothetical protein